MSDEEWNIFFEAIQALSIDGKMLSEISGLHQNYANSFNPTLQIRYIYLRYFIDCT